MATKDQIIRQIKFELSQLSARNAQFEFESLCRHLARATICSNILVSTGPVAGTGDQGRDFETFKTYIERTEFSGSIFAKLVSTGTLAFPASIQKDNIDDKIKSDVAKIMASGTPVDSIFFFSPHNIRVADRHAIQDWVKEEYSTHLEVFDGETISELLAERDLFWIAERFLGISAEFYPREQEADKWYKELFEKHHQESLRFTYSEFYQIKNSGRYTIFNEKFRQDLPFWTEKLKRYLDVDYINLKWKSIYEIAWLSLKGFSSLEGQEDQLREYFSRIPLLINLQNIEDTANLIQYILVAINQEIVGLNYTEVKEWIAQLTERIEFLIDQEPKPFSLCSLLMTRGMVAIVNNFFHVFQQGDELDFTVAYEWWKRLIDIVEEAPLFHLDSLVKLLNTFITLFDKNPDFRELIETVDKRVSEKKGEAAIAENCRYRAETFYRNGEITKAINEFHTAKLNWFNEETIHESLISMLMLSSYYNDLGLSMAGKYYALAAAYIALHYEKPMLKPLVPRALFLASDSDFVQGNWLNFLRLSRIAFYFHDSLSVNPWDFDFHNTLYSAAFHISMLLAISKLYCEALFQPILERIEHLPIFSFIETTSNKALEKYNSTDFEELWEIFEEQLVGKPFNDCTKSQLIAFYALGIKWEIEWQNNYNLTIISEQLISVLQILLVELVDFDLCLLKTRVKIEVNLGVVKQPKFEPIPSNEGRKWKVTFPANYIDREVDVNIVLKDVFSILSIILYEVSMLKPEDFKEIYNTDFFKEVTTKIFVGNTYIKVFKQFVDEGVFRSIETNDFEIAAFDKEFNIRVIEELKWNDSLGPGYSSEKTVEFLKNNYKYSTLPIKYTLKKCIDSTDIIDRINDLKEQGWRDWQIVNVMVSITITYRLKQQGIADLQKIQEKTYEQMFIEEREDDIEIPLSEFSDQNFQMVLNAGLISRLRVWGLDCHQNTPDFPAIRHFLDVRYNNRTDDIEHEDFFT